LGCGHSSLRVYESRIHALGKDRFYRNATRHRNDLANIPNYRENTLIAFTSISVLQLLPARGFNLFNCGNTKQIAVDLLPVSED